MSTPGQPTDQGTASVPRSSHTTTTDSPPTPVGKVLAPLARELAESTAEHVGACIRPLAVRRIDQTTGDKLVVPIPCGSTRASVCPPCADRARRLRIHQAREGWHLAEEPQILTAEPTVHQRAILGLLADLTDARAVALAHQDTATVAGLDEQIAQAESLLAAEGIRGQLRTSTPDDEAKKRRVRSTRRRQDVPDLPRKRVSSRTTGRVYEAPDGAVYQPSTFATLTLDSYGPVHGVRCRCGRAHHPDDGIVGTPLDPGAYDYRRAARDAIHFGELVDRFWQNLRRATGWNVQYFACVEPQKRLAMHLHAAIRGTIPRALLRQVVQATYHQVWWPHHDQPAYQLERLPVWDEYTQSYLDPDTLRSLPTWDEALDEIDTDPHAAPAHVIRFGTNGIDVQGVLGGTDKAGKCLGYLVKYMTKDLAECYEPDTDPQRAHLDRLAAALRYEPCSPRCANWLLHGVQPEGATAGMMPGHCTNKAHKPATLGYNGRRCLVSRKWSGKNLTEHRVDRRNHVLKTLGVVGAHVHQITDDPDQTRYRWEPIKPTDPDQPNRTELLLRSIAQHQRWRHQYQQAKDRLEHSATGDQAA